MIEIKVSDPVFRFLGGHFHQDIESPEKALVEYLNEASQKLKERDLITLTEFVNNDYSKEDKNEFIEEAADGIYFPEDDITPLEWLKQVIEQIKEHLKTI
ncbi:contact-dependent growth inhibition system immunity protein [Bacillus inaquosorum]|uniref:contact-dependent growth inhibition system immunity protein n=1 Tax=Bacillus inaquosorum TaxID=483913 RepID=UPI00227E28AE|nr:contact-dependent growth inhibition system immunity protein [Bacillus inaquosorum]MCY7965020.1 contact-dependent growth inhibition system immunity protein [Bacillus inaquosorum]MCY8030674.1 contact-dependent growth inhibition system immunity protein [Bacillus inaquosorum]MCY8847841.1 contact-dependent growth inhibition system immunity protein [Bacillus inaquosorum]MCY8868499.1 contact-dependent growth inhibition system immunity protein [Bacillus inaquosorum]MCY9067717.1 contact-dependent gr